MTKNNFDKDKEGSGGCPLPGHTCGQAGEGGMKDRRPEMSEKKCMTVNDVGLLYDQNSPSGVPYILGPNQRRLFDMVHFVGVAIPWERNHQLSLAMGDLVERMREPANGAAPPYSEEQMMAIMLNARSRRIAMNQILRIAEYVNMRVEGSVNWSRGLALALGLPENINTARVLHEAAVAFTTEFADLITLIKSTANFVGTRDYLFGISVVKEDDEMFRYIYADDCETPTLTAFYCNFIPKFVVNGTKVEMSGGYDFADWWNSSSVTDVINKLTALCNQIRADIMALKSPAYTALLIDIHNYETKAKLHLGPVCFDGVERLTANENECARVTKIAILSDKWVQRIRNAFGLQMRVRYEAGGAHLSSAYPSEMSIDMASGDVVNKYLENLNLTATHGYPVVTMKGFSISSEGKCSRDVSSASFFIVTGTYQDSLVSESGVNTREITLQENRGYVYLDAATTWDSDNATDAVARNSSATMQTWARTQNGYWNLAAVSSTSRVIPPVVVGAADGSSITGDLIMQKFRALEWKTARLMRVYHQDAALELWLSIAMFSHVQCSGGSDAEIAQSVTKP